MKKSKFKYILILAIILLIGWVVYMLSAERIYIYNTMADQKIDVTGYYNTGDFYIYTDPDDVTDQNLIRRHPPKFWSGEDILKLIKQKKVFITYASELLNNQEQIIEKIIATFPDFSQRMRYYVSYVNDRGVLKEMFIGYFELDGIEYTLSFTDGSFYADRSNIDDVSELTINLSKNYFNFPSSYEKYLEEAKKQPQPPL